MRTYTGKFLALAALLAVSIGCNDGITPTGPSKVVVISSISPSQGSTTVATIVNVRGAGFESGAIVSIGALQIPAVVFDNQSLTISVPPQPVGLRDVTITNPSGTSVVFRGGFQFMPGPPTDHVGIVITGQIFAENSDTPVAGATVHLPGSTVISVRAPQTDDDGRFTLEGTVSNAADDIQLLVSLERIGSWPVSIPRSSASSAVIRLPGLLMLRAGSQVTSDITLANALLCTIESVACRILHVVGPAGSRIDVELIAHDKQEVGLILEETILAPRSFPQRATVPPSNLFVMGDYGKFTIKASAAK